MTATIPTRLFSVDEYHRMADVGILHPEERVELIDGIIIPMAAKNPPHSATTKCASSYFVDILEGLADVRVQEPIHLNDRSEPEPDIALVRTHPRDYIDHHPTPEEVFLLIEVADSTLKFDTEVKNLVYARAAITEYWVLDVNEQQVFIFRSPSSNGYQDETTLDINAIASLVAFPNIGVASNRLFP